MKIKTKLALGFTAVVSFTVIIAAAGLFSVNKISSNMNDLSENMLPASEAAEHLVIFVWQINAEFKGLMCISSREKAKEAYEKIKFSIKNIKDAAGYLKEKLSGEKKFIAYVNDLEAALKNLEGLNDEIHKLILSKIEIEEKSIKLKDKFVSNIRSSVVFIDKEVDSSEADQKVFVSQYEKEIGSIKQSVEAFGELADRVLSKPKEEIKEEPAPPGVLALQALPSSQENKKTEILGKEYEAVKAKISDLNSNFEVISKAFYGLSNKTLMLIRYFHLFETDITLAANACEQIVAAKDIVFIDKLKVEFNGYISVVNAHISKMEADMPQKDISILKRNVRDLEQLVIADEGIFNFRKKLLLNQKNSLLIIESVNELVKKFTDIVNSAEAGLSLQVNKSTDLTRRIASVSTKGIGISSVIVIIFGIVIAILISTFIAGNLNHVTNWIKKLSDDLSAYKADLTQKLKMRSRDELGVLGNSFDNFLENFAKMTKVMSSSASKIDAGAKNILDTSQHIKSAVSGINESVNRITAGSTVQVEKVEEVITIMGCLGESLHEISAKTKAVVESMLKTIELTDKGRASNKELVKKIDSIADKVESSADAVKELSNRSLQIGKIIDTINSFAEQTNMLALNAAIEAARAGDVGRGFAVVAEEVRKLAEGSSRSANEITNLIKSVQSEVKNTIEVIQTSKQDTLEGKNIVEKLSILQNSISDASRFSNQGLAKIVQLIPLQIESAEKAVTAIAEINAAASDNSQITEEVSRAAQELSSSMEELIGNAGGFTKLVDRLQALVNNFRV